MGKTAILVDGGFYQKRMQTLLGKKSAEERADELIIYCRRHLIERLGNKENHHELYRIFYYDCPPQDSQVYNPLLDKNINLQKTVQYTWMKTFIQSLYSKRKVAVRLGKLGTNPQYILKYDTVKKLLRKDITVEDINENDLSLDVQQKGVDMRIGIDIASLAFKKQVDQIVLIAGDSDFVPAAKLARREGIDFILDPLNQSISPDLFEHIDGKRTCLSKEEITNKKLKTIKIGTTFK